MLSGKYLSNAFIIFFLLKIFSLMNFVAFSTAAGETINQQLIQHGANIVINAIFVFLSMLLTLLYLQYKYPD